MNRHNGEVCTIVNLESALLPLVLKLFERGIIDESTKNDVDRQNDYKGAKMVMEYLQRKVEQTPEIFPTVLEVMGEVNALEAVVEKMKDEAHVYVENKGINFITIGME